MTSMLELPPSARALSRTAQRLPAVCLRGSPPGEPQAAGSLPLRRRVRVRRQPGLRSSSWCTRCRRPTSLAFVLAAVIAVDEQLLLEPSLDVPGQGGPPGSPGRAILPRIVPRARSSRPASTRCSCTPSGSSSTPWPTASPGSSPRRSPSSCRSSGASRPDPRVAPAGRCGWRCVCACALRRAERCCSRCALPAAALAAGNPPGQPAPISAPPGAVRRSPSAYRSSMTKPPAGFRLTGNQVLATRQEEPGRDRGARRSTRTWSPTSTRAGSASGR